MAPDGLLRDAQEVAIWLAAREEGVVGQGGDDADSSGVDYLRLTDKLDESGARLVAWTGIPREEWRDTGHGADRYKTCFEAHGIKLLRGGCQPGMGAHLACPGGTLAQSLAVYNGHLYVGHASDGALSVYGANSGAALGTIDTGGVYPVGINYLLVRRRIVQSSRFRPVPQMIVSIVSHA